MKHRKLRIAWSALAIAVCVLLLLMRWQSFTRPVNLNIPGGHWATMIRGKCYFDTSFDVSQGLSRPLPNSVVTSTGAPLAPDGKATAIPLLATALLVATVGVVALVPWSRKFSLLTLLIATTLVAVGLWLIVWLR
jgi:hypothetical protein